MRSSASVSRFVSSSTQPRSMSTVRAVSIAEEITPSAGSGAAGPALTEGGEPGSDHERCREQDEVLDDELALDGEQKRVPVAERDPREQDEHEERAGHLEHEERQREPHQP